jgi:hypothetical protein
MAGAALAGWLAGTSATIQASNLLPGLHSSITAQDSLRTRTLSEGETLLQGPKLLLGPSVGPTHADARAAERCDNRELRLSAGLAV